MPAPTIKQIPISDIRIDGDTQPREQIDQSTVAEYAEAMKGGASFPPPVVFHDGRHHWLADGFHRYHAAAKNGQKKLAVDLRTGTVADAQDYSDGANSTHGLKRSNADKRRAVTRMVARHPEWTDRRLADHCGVGHPLVADARRQLEESSSCPAPEKRVGIDGRERRVAVKAPPRPSAAPSRPAGAKAPERPAQRTDEAGRPVKHPEVIAALDGVDEFDEIVNRLHALRRDIAKLAGVKRGAHITPRLQQVEADIKSVVNVIKLATPYTTCPNMPNCRGGCKVCHGSCVVSQEIWERIPPEERS